MQWPAGQTINRVDSTPTAVASVDLSSYFRNELILFWKANDPSNRIYYSASGSGAPWPLGQMLNNIDSTPQTPAACFFNEELYLFWPANDPSQLIYYTSSFNGSTWPASKTVNNSFKTTTPVSVCVFQNLLYLFWINDGSQIQYSTNDGVNWSNPSGLESGTELSNVAPFACVFNNGLYLFWVSGNGAIQYNVLTSAGWEDVIFIIPSQAIPVVSKPAFHPVSACVYNNQLHLFFQTDVFFQIIHTVSPDGENWSACTLINDIDSTPSAVSSCVFNGQIFVFWEANDPSNGIFFSASGAYLITALNYPNNVGEGAFGTPFAGLSFSLAGASETAPQPAQSQISPGQYEVDVTPGTPLVLGPIWQAAGYSIVTSSGASTSQTISGSPATIYVQAPNVIG